MEHLSKKHKFAREFEALSSINPCLLLPVYIDDDVRLWGSDLIVEYLLANDARPAQLLATRRATTSAVLRTD
jgi:glutathione S-transferase